MVTHHFEVPVIAVFTKYDQFLFNVEMDVFDDPDEYPDGDVSEEAKKRFQEYYLRPLGTDDRYVRLESAYRLICQDYTGDDLFGRYEPEKEPLQRAY
jgi:hypothetical protein